MRLNHRVDLIKLFWCKFTHCFLKVIKIMVTLIKYKKARVKLYQKSFQVDLRYQNWQLIYPNFGVNYDFKFLTGLGSQQTLKNCFSQKTPGLYLIEWQILWLKVSVVVADGVVQASEEEPVVNGIKLFVFVNDIKA